MAVIEDESGGLVTPENAKEVGGNQVDTLSEDAAMFQDSFHGWLELHGVSIGQYDHTRQAFQATVDLNKLKPAIISLDLEEPVEKA